MPCSRGLVCPCGVRVLGQSEGDEAEKGDEDNGKGLQGVEVATILIREFGASLDKNYSPSYLQQSVFYFVFLRACCHSSVSHILLFIYFLLQGILSSFVQSLFCTSQFSFSFSS